MTIRLNFRLISIVMLAVLAATGVVLILAATPEGMGLSDDSIAYIAGARSILAGHGYREAWLASNGPMTHFPPVFPSALAFLGLFGLDPLRGVRFLNALLFGLNTALMGILGWRMTRSLVAGLGLALLFLLNGSLLQVHATALSEPLFIFLSLLAFWIFDLYFERDTHWLWLVVCGTVVGVAYLTRYAALGLVLTFLAALTMLHASWRRRLAAMGIFVVSMLPWLVAWAIRNALVGGTVTNRILTWHPVTASNFDTALRTASSFLMPVEAWRIGIFKMPDLLLLIIGLILAGVLAWVLIEWKQRMAKSPPTRRQVVTFTSAVFVWCYLISILAAMSFFDASTKFKLRILAPIYVALLILLVAAGVWLWHKRRELAVLLGVAVLAASGYGQARTVADFARGGQGYASFKWYDSKAMQFLRSLPMATRIYTNEPGAVYLYTGRGTYVLPDRVDPVTAEVRPGFDQGLAELQADVRSGDAVLALFSGGDSSLSNSAELSRGLFLAHKSAGAEIYTASP
jgi:4-amino-4-deoxy-L-arabinose transferase-like glycosyltransferase